PLSKNIAFRMNGTYEYAESFRDLVQSKKHYFNPSFVFNIGENTQLIVEGDYLHHEFTPDFGIGSVTDEATGISRLATEISRNQFLGAGWQYQTNQQASTDVILNHKFSNSWTLNAVASYQNYTKDYFSTERIQWTYNSSKNNMSPKWKRSVGRTYNEQNYTSLQINLNGEFKTGKINHKMLIGTDGDYSQADNYTYNIQSGDFGELILNNPATWSNEALQPVADRSYRRRIPTRRFGVYVQDFIELTKSIKLLAGLRYSYLTNGESADNIFIPGTKVPAASAETKNHAFSPKVGLVYAPNENLSLFATYTNSFVPNTGFDFYSRAALDPSVVDQYEIGIKKNFWNDAVAVNLSVYQINNNNTYTQPINNPSGDTTLRIYAGAVRSRGVELDLTGNPSKNLSLIGGVSYNNAVYTKTPDDGFIEDQRLVRTPAVTANASVFYTFDDFAKGLVIGATAFYTGDRKAGWNDVKGQKQVTRMIDVEGFTTLDLSIGYQWKKFMVQGKAGNVFDVVNYNVHENYSVNPVMPRNYYVTLTYKL
uniref:TonB-dependent siderophore receptor n=1 Tax=uncultured Chryseobacterium sp. TaxID=259322 RepID=UPI0025F92933